MSASPLAARLAALSPRDRRILAIGAPLAAALLLWAFAWDPLARSRDELRTLALAQAEAMPRLRAQADAALARGPQAAAPVDGRSLIARVDAELRAAGLGGALVGVEPQGEGRVRVQLVGADFETLVATLEGPLASAAVDELSLQRAGAEGRVDGRLVLREGPR